MPGESNSWTLVEHEFDIANNRHLESLMTLGSGPLQQRGSLEEGLAHDPQDAEFLRIIGGVTPAPLPAAKSNVGTYLPGISGPHPTCRDQMINLPALHGFMLYAGIERLDMQTSRLRDYRRELDIRTAKLRRQFIWHTQAGAEVRITFERFISARRRHVMALRCRLENVGEQPAELRFVSTLDADVRTNGYDHFRSVAFTGEHEPITVVVNTNGNDEVAAAAVVTADPGGIWAVETELRWAGVAGSIFLDPHQKLELSKFAAMTSSQHVPGSPLDTARNLVWNAAGTGYRRLAEEHDAIWEARWDASDVHIEGDSESQLALRLAQYHLMRSVFETGERCGIDANAASSAHACGRQRWETDLFALPMFLYTRPQVGRALARFRTRTLDGARRNAQILGYQGARYAYESSPTGDENSPNELTSLLKAHVSADVAYALWHAWSVDPNDKIYLAEMTETLTEIARFWSQRVSFDADREEYEVLAVTGPDEYSPFCRNNAFTNHMVALALSLVQPAWDQLRELDPTTHDRLRAQCNLDDDELANFASIAESLGVPYDAELRLILASDAFFDFEPLDLDELWEDRNLPFLASSSVDRVHRSQVIQQADTLLLLALYRQQFEIDQIRAAYAAYAPLTTHDAPASRPVHALIAAIAGLPEEATDHWRDAVAFALKPGAWSHGVEVAYCGALWQAAILGFAGIQTAMQADELTIRPNLPDGWRALRFAFVWQQQPLRITIRANELTIEHRGDQPIDAIVHEQPYTLLPNTTQTCTAPKD